MKIDPKNLEWREAHDLLTSIVMPRPIAFVSTIGEDGVFNVAPFSLFTGILPHVNDCGLLHRQKTGWRQEGYPGQYLVLRRFYYQY